MPANPTCHPTLGEAGAVTRGEDTLYMGASYETDLLGAFNHYTNVHQREYAIGGDPTACVFSKEHYPTAVLEATATEPGVGPCVLAATYTASGKMKFRGGPLVSTSVETISPWVFKNAQASTVARLEGHVSKAVKGAAAVTGVSVYSWDVVGEVLTYEPATGSDTIGSWAVPSGQSEKNVLGYLYATDAMAALVKLFKVAATANEGGDAKLCYSDRMVFDDSSNRVSAVASLIRELIHLGAPIDCMALQLRTSYGRAPSVDGMRLLLGALAHHAMVEVHLTEVQVDCDKCDGDDDVALERQALVYRDMLEACTLVDECTVFQTAGFRDTSTSKDYALPFAADLTKRPAYHKMLDLLNHRTCTDNRTSP